LLSFFQLNEILKIFCDAIQTKSQEERTWNCKPFEFAPECRQGDETIMSHLNLPSNVDKETIMSQFEFTLKCRRKDDYVTI